MKSFLRFLRRNPYYTVINVLGLSVALMFVILIGDYTWRQFSTDSSQPNKDRIVLMGRSGDYMTWPEESWKIAGIYPEIENTCCVVSQGGTIRSDKESFRDVEGNPMLLVDSTFFNMFSYDFVEGNPRDAMSSPDRCVITESLADAIFPGQDPMGEPLRIIGMRSVFMNNGTQDPYDSTLVYTVSGVVRDFDKTVLPNDTKIIASINRHPQILGYNMTPQCFVSTSHGCFKTFYLLQKGAELDTKAGEIWSTLVEDIPMMEFDVDVSKTTASFTPLRKVMFDEQNNGSGLEKGNKGLLVILLSAVIAILLFAVTNYINLTVANTGMRAKEMATRRLLGSSSTDVIIKLVVESILMVLISFLIGLGLSFLFQDDMASMFRGRIMLENDLTPRTACTCICFILVTGLLAGIIPGIQISAFKAIDVVKGTFRYKSKMVFSRAFIMLQNLVTVVMLTLSLVVALQINGLVNAPLGINSKDVLFISPDEPGDSEAILSTLRQLPCVERIGFSRGSCLSMGMSSMRLMKDKEGATHLIYQASLDREAMEIYGVEILNDYGAPEGSVYINERMKETLGISDSDREIQWQGGNVEQIAGVIKNFHKGNILADIGEFEIYPKDPETMKNPDLVVKTDGTPEALRTIKAAVAEILTDRNDVDRVVQNLEEEVASQFDEERNVLHIVLMFTGIALLISIFGFIGLSLFFIRQRRNEVAVRRIMGGSVREVIVLMLTKFCAPLLMSCIVAVPVAYFISDKWLQGFSYRIPLSAWIFILTCAVSLLIAVLSVLWQTVQAVMRNPAEGIKTE
ncbi:MAG: ABC transporter permease [Bacteroidales bacterium]|nr:ABC transporter permease [Bacteroidales bacterium]